MFQAYVFLTVSLNTCDMIQLGTNHHERRITIGNCANNASPALNLTFWSFNGFWGADFRPILKEKLI